MAEHVAAGDRAFVDEDYKRAVAHYTKALEVQPSTNVYEARANANVKLENYVDAVQDANKALELDSKNVKAYLRKGVACFKLEEYETALQAFQQAHELKPDNYQTAIWAKKCEMKLEDENGAAPPTKVVSVSVEPPKPRVAAQKLAAAQQPAATPPAVLASSAPAAAVDSNGSLKPLAQAAVEAFNGKYRHQWYQIGNKVVVDVYAKNQPKDAVSVQLSDDGTHLSINIAAPTAAAAAGASSKGSSQAAEDFVLEFTLFGKVSQNIKVEVLKTKVEIAMVKEQANISWPTLEKSGKGMAVPAASVAAAAVPAESQGAPRLYPSSKGPKDWSKVEAEVKQLEEKGELEDGDPLNNFFKKIFGQGDEDTRRAMMKSFVESNGTVLSTNWKEVGAKPVEWSPPEGMEVHKWNE